MRLGLASIALASLLAANGAWARDEPSSNAEILKDLRETQSQRNRAEPAQDSAKKLTLDEHLAKGDEQREKGDHPRALWSYLLAHRLDTKDPRPIGRIGTLHLSREPERAEVIFRQLLLQGDDDALARTGLGLALIARGAWGEAVVELRQAVDEDEGLAATHNALGVALDRQKQYEAARWHYRRATEIQPRSHEPWNNLGVSLLATGDYASAVEALQEAGRLEARDAATWNNLGVALGRMQRYDAALEAFRKAGDERTAQNNLGYVHYLNGDYDGALVAYERALHAAGKAEERLPVLRNARVAQQAKSRPAARPPPAPTPAPQSGADAPGLGAEPGLLVEDVAPPAAPAAEAVLEDVAPPAALAPEGALEETAPPAAPAPDEVLEDAASLAQDTEAVVEGDSEATVAADAESAPAP
jgi:Flp pilus assembly protein TadD